jgi:hypothetical protein
MLRRQSSFVSVIISGQLENVFDLREESKLSAFVSIVKRFTLTKETREIARKNGIPRGSLVRSAKQLKTKLLASSKEWRVEPLLADIPAPSQVFGRYIEAAGYEGLLFPSQQGGTLCLAIYPRNFARSNAYLEVRGRPPSNSTCTRLDRANLCLMGLKATSLSTAHR